MLFFLLACATTRSELPDIVLVSMDTLRADRLGSYGNKDNLTPNLDRFASEAIVFEHAYSQATLTAPSHASMFTSRYPSEETGLGRRPVFGEDKVPMAKILQVYGYQTGAFVGGADLNPHMGLDLGFDTYLSPCDFGSLWHTVGPALEWITHRDRSRPFFAFVHGYDAHARYLKPAPYGYMHANAAWDGIGQKAVRSATERVVDQAFYADMEPFARVHEMFLRPRTPAVKALLPTLAPAPPTPVTDTDLELIRGVYDGAVAWGDAQFGRFMAGLAADGLLDHTVIVLMADHGEQLGEEGLFQHCCGLGDAETHVPLMVRMPNGQNGGQRITAAVGLIDLLPTLVELAGGMSPAGIYGKSLVPALQGKPFDGHEVIFSQGNDRMRSVSARSLQGRLTYTGITVTSPLLPELIASASLSGPGFVWNEEQPEAPALSPETQAQLRDATVQWLKQLAPSPKNQPVPMPANLKNELRKHGYWEVEP